MLRYMLCTSVHDMHAVLQYRIHVTSLVRSSPQFPPAVSSTLSSPSGQKFARLGNSFGRHQLINSTVSLLIIKYSPHICIFIA